MFKSIPHDCGNMGNPGCKFSILFTNFRALVCGMFHMSLSSTGLAVLAMKFYDSKSYDVQTTKRASMQFEDNAG